MADENPLEDGEMEIGRITIVYYIDKDGESITKVKFPDWDKVPLIVQLGMLEMTRQTLWNQAEGK